jgi:hypothetical protein
MSGGIEYFKALKTKSMHNWKYGNDSINYFGTKKTFGIKMAPKIEYDTKKN